MTFMQRILLIKTSSLGDVIHNCPVIADIRAHFPDALIDWVTEEAFADIPRMHAGVNQVITVAVRRWRKQIFSQNTWSEISAFKQLIKQKSYDAIIDTQGLLKSALIARTAHGIKHGYDKNSIREPLASWFYDNTYAISYQQHAVTRNRALVAMSLGYTPPTNAPDYGISPKKDASESLIDVGLQGNTIVALHGTSRDSKLWPVGHWVDLGKQLAKQNFNLALPWANEVEYKRANEIAKQLQNATVLPKLSIAQLANIIAASQAAIGVDTGLSHLSAALNIPTIAIYTDTNPALTGVMASAQVQAINLGNIAEIPSVNDVIDSLKQIL
jgi:heptosyltransferase-1